jgi:hypothetical protein
LRAQEKVSKEKGTRSPCRLTPMPCVPRRSGSAHNSADLRRSASDRMRAFIPERLRYSARPTRPGYFPLPHRKQHRRRITAFGIIRPTETGLPFHFRRRSRASQGKPGQARPCLSVSSNERDRESGERRFSREAQVTRDSGQASGPPFFGVLFFGGAKKSTSPDRAKPGQDLRLGTDPGPYLDRGDNFHVGLRRYAPNPTYAKHGGRMRVRLARRV